MQTIEIDGRPVPYSIRRSKRARRCWLKVTPEDGLVVVQPRGMTRADIPEVLQSESRWIFKQLDRLAAMPPPALPHDVDNGSEVMYGGERMVVNVSLSANGLRHPTVKPDGRSIQVTIPLGCDLPVREILETWMRNRAKWLIRAEVHELATARNLKYNRVYIRDQKTKWGSCSTNGNISFNWRLVMAPPHVLRYLVAHELAHLMEFGHSKAFWNALADLCPEYEEAKAWLHEHGHSLRF